jgi:hypothetical protein
MKQFLERMVDLLRRIFEFSRSVQITQPRGAILCALFQLLILVAMATFFRGSLSSPVRARQRGVESSAPAETGPEAESASSQVNA